MHGITTQCNVCLFAFFVWYFSELMLCFFLVYANMCNNPMSNCVFALTLADCVQINCRHFASTLKNRWSCEFLFVFSLSLGDCFVIMILLLFFRLWTKILRSLAWPTAFYQIFSEREILKEKNQLFHGWPFLWLYTENRFTLSHRKYKSENGHQMKRIKRNKTIGYGAMKNGDILDFRP